MLERCLLRFPPEAISVSPDIPCKRDQHNLYVHPKYLNGSNFCVLEIKALVGVEKYLINYWFGK